MWLLGIELGPLEEQAVFLTAEPSFQSSMHEAQDSIPRNPIPSKKKHLSPCSEGWDIQELSFASVSL